MSTVNYMMSYVNQQPQSAFIPLSIRFSYWSERVIGRREIVVIDSVSPNFQCQIDTQSVAHQHPALLCIYLQNFLSWCDRSLDYTSRLKLAQDIAGSLEEKLRYFPLREVTVEVEVIEQRRRDHHRHQQQQRMVDGDVLIMDGGNVVSRRRGAARSWIHRHDQQQQQLIMNANVLIFDEGNVETGSGPGPMTGVSRSAMKKLMKEGRFYYHNGGGGEGEKADVEECSICWENYIEGIEAIKMPSCLHVFHQKCIVRWLKTKNSCPLCRKTV